MRNTVVRNKRIVTGQIQKPELKEKGALIKVIACGLCGSDIVKILNNNENATLGHEMVGVIEEINCLSKFKIGDIVVLGHHVPCGKCVFCKHGNVSMCKQFKQTNIFPGGFSDYVVVTKKHLDNTVFKIKKTDDFIHFSFLEPLACCIRAIERAKLKKKDKCLVVGLGSIGLLMAQALKVYGADVFGLDIIDERTKFAHKLNIRTGEKEKTMDAVFMTSGSNKAIETSLNNVRDGGKIIIFSSIKTDEGYKNNDIYYRELSVMGSYSPSPEDLKKSYKLLRENKIKTEGISTVFKLEDLQKAIEETIANRILKAYIKL